MLESRGRPELASLRSAQTSGASQKLKRASARLGILCFSAVQKGNSRHPAKRVGGTRMRCSCGSREGDVNLLQQIRFEAGVAPGLRARLHERRDRPEEARKT